LHKRSPGYGASGFRTSERGLACVREAPRPRGHRHPARASPYALALKRDSLELLGIKLEIVALADLVALDDICRINFVTRFRIDLAVFDTVASFPVERAEADSSCARRWPETEQLEGEAKF
jgi:hypothetical protein